MSDGSSRSARSGAASFCSREAARRGIDVGSPTIPLVEVLALRVLLVIEIVAIVIEVVVLTVGGVVFVLVRVIFLDRFEFHGGGTGYFEIGSAVGAAD